MSEPHPFVANEVRLTVSCLVLACIYFLLGQTGLLLATEHHNVSPLWPASGLAVAAVFLFGYRIWPGVFLGAFLVTVSASASVITALFVAAGNTAEALIACWFTLRLIGTTYPLSHPQHVFKFIFAAGFVATLISASVGLLTLIAFGSVQWSGSSNLLFTWWLGDMGGVVLVTPLILAWANPLKDRLQTQLYLEALILFASTLVVAEYVFGSWSAVSAANYPLAFVCLPLLVWTAFRFGQRGSTTIIALVAVVAITGTLQGYGPFNMVTANKSIMMLQSFIAVITITTLALAALVKERKLAEAALRKAHDELELNVQDRTHALMIANHALEESEAKWRSITESSPDNIMLLDPSGIILFNNYTVPNLTVTHMIGASVYDHVPEQQRQLMRDCFREVTQTREPAQFTIDYEHNGQVVNFENRVGPVIKNDEVVALTMSCRDVTERARAEAQIRQLNKRMGMLLESTSEGIFGVDTSLKCTFANRAAAEMLNRSVEDMLGRDMCELARFSGEDGKQYLRDECLINRTICENRGFVSDEVFIWANEDKCFPVQLTANPITENNRVVGAAVVFHNITEARAMARKMDFLAAHDPLTGLVNRREFELRLQRALDGAITENSVHVLCYLDLDQFKIVNDTCGHIAGDELLRQLTVLLQEKVRQNDTLARLGGDEFGILMAHCDVSHAQKVLETIRQVVEGFRFVWEGKTFAVGVSIGVTRIDSTTSSVSDAMSEADSACYMAKDSGRNRIHVYEADDEVMARRYGEMQWVSRIHEAFEQQRLSLMCQPIVPISAFTRKRGKFVATSDGMFFEVLIRMMDEQGQRVPPGAFIPAAERYNLMPSIDRWVVKNTLDWLQSNSDQLDTVTFCTINLSGHSLNDEHFLEFVTEGLAQSGIDGEKICFEITETAAVANLTQAVHFIRTLKLNGCRFALDDFGSGMSSFAYLKNLPVDFLKIDGNFVRDIIDDPVDFAMVEAVNRVGHVMGIKTIAEFVENDEVLERLQKMGVDYVQGYGIAIPRAIEDVFPCIN
jgi:diguanylate cyclase (GGDEF)-like protein/PAS domain S-box-containing protein